jgi:hypothetical protein
VFIPGSHRGAEKLEDGKFRAMPGATNPSGTADAQILGRSITNIISTSRFSKFGSTYFQRRCPFAGILNGDQLKPGKM